MPKLTNAELINVQASEYLSFRSFYTEFGPDAARLPQIRTFDELRAVIQREIAKAERPALMLSGGMDSAIMVPFMPKKSVAYTFTHPQITKDEVSIARDYTEQFGLVHKVIQLDVDQYFDVMPLLMKNKRMPLSPAEPIFHILSLEAAADGHSHIVTGAGSDLKQGGFPSLRKRRTRWSFERKLNRAYLCPQAILKKGTGIQHVLKEYSKPSFAKVMIDAQRFLTEVGTEAHAFDNAISSAGIGHIAPLTTVLCPFDAQRNAQMPKAYIQEFFKDIYGTLPPKKLGLQKPSFALEGYRPERDEFRQDFNYEGLDYNRRYLVYSLERFMNEIGFAHQS